MAKQLKRIYNWPKTTNLLSVVRYRLQAWGKPVKNLPSTALSEALKGGAADASFKNLSFTFAAIALSAKIACADGVMTQAKYIAYRESFPLSGNICSKIRALFALACKNETPFEHYVGQIKYSFHDKPELLLSFVERLFRIAAADGTVSKAEERLLSSIAHMLGISTADYSALCERYGRSDQAPNKKSAHHIMGVNKRASAATLKKRYHELMQRYHPDRYAGYELSPEVHQLLQLKSSEINAAYKALSSR